MWNSVIRPLARWVVRAAHHQSDLVVLGTILVLLQGLLDRESGLADPSWEAWTVLNVAVLALFRGRSIGLGAHPDLETRGKSRVSRLVLAGGAPLWVWFAVGSLRQDETGLMPLLAVTVVLIVAAWRRRSKERTAWAPDAPAASALVLTALLIFFAMLFGAASQDPRWSLACLSGSCFYAVALALGDPRALAQRWVSWDGNPLWGIGRRLSFNFIALIALPCIGFELVADLMMKSGPSGHLPGDGFNWASLATVYIMVWGAIAWKRPVPSGVACMLREVAPAAGIERKGTEGAALQFGEAPRGALAVEPLAVKRSKRFHPWYVTVDSGRAKSADGRARPLWHRWEPATGHALGHAQCAQDGVPGLIPLAQWNEVTIIPQARETRESWGESQAGVRREVVLRPFRRLLHPPLAQVPPTFSWESKAAQRLYQLNSGRPLRLSAGDILVLSSSGIVRCFEFEPGAPLELTGVRHIPQPEDYLDSSK